MPRTRFVVMVAVLVSVVCGSLVASAAAARPAIPDGPTAALRAKVAAKDSLPTCVDEHRCTIVKDTNSADPSCSRYSSQVTPPTSIRVLVRTGGQTGTYTIETINFTTYLDNVLPDEWDASYDFDALKAGAVAVKSYAWYWVTHYGGYLGSTRSSSTCFDVTDDQLFQMYLPNTATSRTNSAIADTGPYAVRENDRIFQASYQKTLTGNTQEACGAGANGSVLSQVGTQDCFDSSPPLHGNTGNKWNVILARYYYPGLQLATGRQQRTPHDFTFDQTSTRVAYSAGRWAIDDGYGTAFTWGRAGDLPVITDNGDGFAHLGVFRPSTGDWYLATPTGTTASVTRFGANGDIPVPGHWNGDAAASVLGVYRPSTHTWYRQKLPTVIWGAKGDIPVPGDYTGDGTDDIATFRPSDGTWYVDGYESVKWGVRGDIPVPADYDGNGTTDVAVYRPSDHTFYVRGSRPVQWGVTGDVPVTGDFTGDGRADLVVYRPSTGTWYVRGYAARGFGPDHATPIGAAPYRA